MTAPRYVVLQVWEQGAPRLDRAWAITAANHLSSLAPRDKIAVSVGGYDSDPRPLVDIPEAMAAVRGFLAELDKLGGGALDKLLERAEPECRPVLLAAVEGGL